MNTDAALIKKYEAYIAELKAANAQQQEVIQIQDESIDTLEKLLAQKQEKIDTLTDELEQVMAAAKEMAGTMDSLFQD